jgi:hypothetical protein
MCLAGVEFLPVISPRPWGEGSCFLVDQLLAERLISCPFEIVFTHGSFFFGLTRPHDPVSDRERRRLSHRLEVFILSTCFQKDFGR